MVRLLISELHRQVESFPSNPVARFISCCKCHRLADLVQVIRNAAPEFQAYGRGQERMIDLHGLHVNEAIHRLRNELSVLRNAARSADQRLQVYICVGTGHHTKGSRTPARLPVAVEHYLLHEEALEYTEPQAGLLRVVIY